MISMYFFGTPVPDRFFLSKIISKDLFFHHFHWNKVLYFIFSSIPFIHWWEESSCPVLVLTGGLSCRQGLLFSWSEEAEGGTCIVSDWATDKVSQWLLLTWRVWNTGFVALEGGYFYNVLYGRLKDTQRFYNWYYIVLQYIS